MAINPDILYLRSREDLLQYEDARLNSLLQGVANFYTTRNDQSTWGNFLRAIAIELAKLDYDYSYDIVGKDPSFLTPADIRRRWADPLYVSSNYPTKTQFDIDFKTMLVELIAAYRQGSTVAGIEAVIFAYTGLHVKVIELYTLIGDGIYDESDANAISVSVTVGGSDPLTSITSVTQLQQIVQSLYSAIDLAKPAHVGLEFTTVFGEGEDLDCSLSPRYLTQSQLAQLDTVQQGFYSLQSYTLINPPLYWLASTISKPITFSVNNFIVDPNGNAQIVVQAGRTGTIQPLPQWQPDHIYSVATFQIVDSNGNIQQVVTKGYSGSSVPVWNVTLSGFTTDGTAPNAVTWQNLGPATSFWNTTIGGLTDDFAGGGSIIWKNIGPVPAATVSLAQYAALPASLQLLYQKQYLNSNCVGTGIDDELTIIIEEVEDPPFDPMLIQAPVLDPSNPTTTIAAWGSQLAKLYPMLTPTAWQNLPIVTLTITSTVADGVNATYTFDDAVPYLHDGEQITIVGCTNGGSAFNVTAKIKDVISDVRLITSVQIAGGVLTIVADNDFDTGDVVHLAFLQNATFLNSPPDYTVVTATPSLFTIAYTQTATITQTQILANVLTVVCANQFVPGETVTLTGTAEPSLNGQTVIVVTASPTQFTAAFTGVNYTNPADTGLATLSTYGPAADTGTASTPGSFQIPLAQTIALASESTATAFLTPTLQSGYYFAFGNYLIGQASWAPTTQFFGSQYIVDNNGNTQMVVSPSPTLATPIQFANSGASLPVWNTTVGGITHDGGLIWRNIGKNPYTMSAKWIAITLAPTTVGLPNNAPLRSPSLTGEVSNWDSTHPTGLLAPRLDQVWEISGGDSDVEMELT